MKKATVIVCTFALIISLPGISKPTYVDNGDGTIMDTGTGLMWRKYDNGAAIGYLEANIYIESLNWQQYSDWRLPSFNELKGICDYILYMPTFDGNESYWTNQVDPIGGPHCTVIIDHGTSTEIVIGWCLSARVLAVREPEGVNAEFSSSPRKGVAPLTVNFTDESTGEITNWLWQFGDGESSAAKNPFHTYTKPGTYTVSLTITGPGGSDDETKPSYIICTCIGGDVNDYKVVDLDDAILSIQVCSGLEPRSKVYKEADISADGKIGMEEVIYILQTISEMR